MTILLDIESRSRADLKKVGGRLYWEHSSSEILCLCWYDTDASGDGVRVWLPGEPPPPWATGGPDLVAHNALGFDRFGVARQWGVPIEVVENGGRWRDSSVLARRAGLPGKLDALGTLWLDRPKDHEGSKLTRSLSTVRRPTQKWAHLAPAGRAISADEWRTLRPGAKRARGYLAPVDIDTLLRVVDYCVSDVEIMVHGWELLEPWITYDAPAFAACCALNDRGVRFDVDLAEALLDADRANQDRVCAEVAATLGDGVTAGDVRTAARSNDQFRELTGAPNAQAATVQALADDRPDTPEGALARARLSLNTIAAGKLRAGLARVGADSRLRDAQRYLGAHTWRWSGQGMQLHNMPRPDDIFEPWSHAQIDALALAVLDGEHAATQAEVDVLLRACICAPEGYELVVADLAGIEQRALAWVAQDHVSLDTIATGRDPYKVAAAAVFGCEYDDVEKPQRPVGKVAELACGYGGGPNALRSMARNLGVDFSASGVDPQRVVEAWRDLHDPVRRLWQDLEDAFKSVARGETSDDGICIGGPGGDAFRIAPSSTGRDVAVWMPSGRPITYRDVRLQRERNTWGGWREAVSYHSPTKNAREYTYGGKLTENVIQALCRELFADGFARVDTDPRARALGLRPVMTVHDELVSECPTAHAVEGLALQIDLMTARPSWPSDGLPLGADGFHARRYRK